jgi:hypothetical protein
MGCLDCAATAGLVECSGADQVDPDAETRGKEPVMLTTIAIVLLVLWLLGLVGNVGGSLIHLLLVVAVIVFLVRVIQGRRPV